MATVDDIQKIVALDHGLAGLSTLRRDGSVQSTVVNAGVIDHPVTGEPVAAFVGRPATRKIAHLRDNPTRHAAVARRLGMGRRRGHRRARRPRRPARRDRTGGLPGLLRGVYSAAGGGEHDDWAEYDRVMAAERRIAVLLTPTRIYVNP